MSHRILLFSLSAFLMLGACSSPPSSTVSPRCSESAVVTASTPVELRGIAKECASNRDVAALALRKLNALTPTPKTKLSLRRQQAKAPAERAVLEAVLYFAPLESYPPDGALEKLESLLSRVSQGYAVESLSIVGGGESTGEGSAASDLARRRAEFIKQYFLRAGLPDTSRVEAVASTPSAALDAETRARARVAFVQVAVLRDQAASQ